MRIDCVCQLRGLIKDLKRKLIFFTVEFFYFLNEKCVVSNAIVKPNIIGNIA